MAVDADWITRYRQATTSWLNALDMLLALKGQYVALDYGNSLTQEDLTGANADIAKEDIVAGVGSVDAINQHFLAGFHNSNLYKLIV
jgi:hypothetical protein